MRARAVRLAGSVARRVPRWVWPAFELVTVAAVVIGTATVLLLCWRLSTAAGVPGRAAWPLLIALPVGLTARVGRDLRSLTTRWCNRRDALLDGWSSSGD